MTAHVDSPRLPLEALQGATALETAMELFVACFWPVVLRPPGQAYCNSKGQDCVATGKEPWRPDWGKTPPTAQALAAAYAYLPDSGVGIRLGAVIDIEWDTPEGEESFHTLCGGEVIETAGWSSARSPHHLFQNDDRLIALGKSVLRHKDLPGLEIRIGSTERQIQSACPPTLDSTGRPREWNGIETIARLPSSAIEILVQLHTPAPPPPRLARPPRRLLDPDSTRESRWFAATIQREADKVAQALEGNRHDTLYDAAYTLGGQIHFGFFDADLVAATLQEAAESAGLPSREAEDTIRAGLKKGDEKRLEWPRELDREPQNMRFPALTPSRANGRNGQHETTPNGRSRTPEDATDQTLERIPSREFFAEKPPPEWLVKGVLITGEPIIIAGPMKSLKTSISLDLCLSLAMGGPFLARWDVPQTKRVLFLSGETGLYVMRQNALAICHTRGLPYEDDQNLFLGHHLPNLADSRDRRRLRNTIKNDGIEFLCIDPLYLCIQSTDNNFSHNNMFHMGPLLREVNSICSELHCTLALVHHFPKNRALPFAPPELSEIAFGGVSNWCRQWLLMTRAERFDPVTGVHQIHFLFGGSFGHAGEYQLAINTGVLGDDFSGRLWNVTIQTPGEQGTAANKQKFDETCEKTQRKLELKKTEITIQERHYMSDALGAFRRANTPGLERFQLTASKLRIATGWRYDRAERILHLMCSEGFLDRDDEHPIAGGQGARNHAVVYTLREEHQNTNTTHA